MNLLFGGNYKVFDGLLTCLLSVVKHNRDPVNVYLMTMDLPELNKDFISVPKREIAVLEGVLKSGNPASSIIKIDVTEKFKKELINSANIDTGYTPYTFLRLFADDIDIIPDKILYLDIDIMLNGNISELYDVDVEGYEYAGVRDYYGKIFFYPNYVNAGVLLLNIKKIRETGLFKKARKLVNDKKIFLSDQTAINKLTTKRLILPSRFNSQKRLKKDTLVRHFCKTIKFFPYFHTVNIKQWDIERVHGKMKCHEFDDVLEQYIQIKNTYAEVTNG